VDESCSHPTEKVKDEIANMAKPVLDVISEDVEKPHVSEDMEKSPMKKHGGHKREPLLECGKLCRDRWIGISYGDNTIEGKSLFQIGALEELPDKGDDIEANEDDIDDRKGL
jgi:hypothetical protein